MRTVTCDHWVGWTGQRTHGETDCQGVIPPGDSYYGVMATGTDGSIDLRMTRGGLDFCRPCMMVAIAEIVQRPDINQVNVRRMVAY